MQNFSSIHFVLAALLLLAGLAGAYQAARRWPGRPGPAALTTTAPPAARAAPDTLAPPVAPQPPAAPRSVEEAPVITSPRDPRPLFELGSPVRRVRRYVGTVGGQPATALLDWQNPAWPQGRFYLHHGGPEYHLDQLSGLPRHVVQVQEAGAWHLRGRPGVTLTGTWRGGPTGRPQAIRLRETYGDAVRLDVQPWRVRGRYTITTSRGDVYSSVPEVQWEFLHLANPANVPPALRPLLSPSPARRRRLLLEKGSIDCIISNELTVRLNDFGLLNYQYDWIISGIGGSSDSNSQQALFDLRTGRWLAPESQLRPGYELGLSRLLARRLLRDDGYFPPDRRPTWRQRLSKLLPLEHDTLRAATCWVQEALPAQGELVFTGAGLELECQLDSFVDASYRERFTVFFSYAELRPLVRPGTPLARLLRARGLW